MHHACDFTRYSLLAVLYALVACAPARNPQVFTSGHIPHATERSSILLVAPGVQGDRLVQLATPVLLANGFEVYRDGNIAYEAFGPERQVVSADTSFRARSVGTSVVNMYNNPKTDLLLVFRGDVGLRNRVNNLSIEVIDPLTGRLLATRSVSTPRMSGIADINQELIELLRPRRPAVGATD